MYGSVRGGCGCVKVLGCGGGCVEVLGCGGGCVKVLGCGGERGKRQGGEWRRVMEGEVRGER